jgi:hypothetical protein
MATRTALWLVPLLACTVVGTAVLSLAAVRASDSAQLLRLVAGADETVMTLDPVTLVSEVRLLARLETATVTVQKMVKGSRGEGVMLGMLEDSMLLVAHGSVIAGVDLERFGPEDITLGPDGIVFVDLPPAEIFSVDLDEGRTHVAHRHQGWFASADRDLETGARREAERAMREQAISLGLLDDADRQAEAVVEQLLLGVGVTAVRFEDPPASS